MMVSAATAFARPQAGVNASSADAQPDARFSPAAKLRSATSAVMDAAARLNKTQTWQATKATSDNESVVQAVSDKAAPGSYTVNVDAVAMAQSTASATFSSLSTVVGIGTLNIELGSWNTSLSTFATNPNWPKASVMLGPKDTSLERIRDKINAAGVGVIALVVSDATGSRLVLRATSTGEANGFKATPAADGQTSPEAAQALASMGMDPQSLRGSNPLNQPAQDARLRIDGREIQSPQNLIEDEPSGLTLRINGSRAEPVKIRVESDTQAIARDIQSFANAYNDMASQLAASEPNADDDSLRAAQAIQQRMQEAFSATAGANSLSQPLQSVGIRLKDGQLQVDDQVLQKALVQNPGQVEQLFDGNEGAGRSSGLATRLLELGRSEDPANATPGPAASGSEQDSPSAAGALFRQRLLEQYAQSSAASWHEDDASMSANAA
ncbi:MAG: flagellar filament capping protein FliD [Aquabacterium sp.]|nr:flagellar filament capping protein FliD [Aquabacterium sp.]